jgi:hypothetical protein
MASEISGIKSVETALSIADGKNKSGSAIPFIAPKSESALSLEWGNFARFLGTKIFSAVRSSEFRYLPDVIGSEICKICFKMG